MDRIESMYCIAKTRVSRERLRRRFWPIFLVFSTRQFDRRFFQGGALKRQTMASSPRRSMVVNATNDTSTITSSLTMAGVLGGGRATTLVMMIESKTYGKARCKSNEALWTFLKKQRRWIVIRFDTCIPCRCSSFSRMRKKCSGRLDAESFNSVGNENLVRWRLFRDEARQFRVKSFLHWFPFNDKERGVGQDPLCSSSS